MKNDKIVCIGELLIDFICKETNTSLVMGNNFIKKAGGAPANVAAAVAKLGGAAVLLGKVGNDSFGTFLIETFKGLGVDTSMVMADTNFSTTLAFVSLLEEGERDFVFYRGADTQLFIDDIKLDDIKQWKAVHFGSATALLGGELKKTYRKILDISLKEGLFISFDPNYRIDLWRNNIDAFRQEAIDYIKYADFTKVSLEELKIITKENSLQKAVEALHKYGGKIIAVTMGKEGTYLSNGREATRVDSIKIDAIDTTGAGDAFVGGFLFKIVRDGNLKDIDKNFEGIIAATRFANVVAAKVCCNLGSITSLPTLEEVSKYL